MREWIFQYFLVYSNICLVIVTCLLGASQGLTTFILPSSFSSPTLRSSFSKPCHANTLLYQANYDGSSSKSSVNVPDFIKSPVLRQVYAAMLQHLETFGNPNIPLGNSDGMYLPKHKYNADFYVYSRLGFLIFLSVLDQMIWIVFWKSERNMKEQWLYTVGNWSINHLFHFSHSLDKINKSN